MINLNLNELLGSHPLSLLTPLSLPHCSSLVVSVTPPPHPHPRHTTLGVGGFQTFPCSPHCSDVLVHPDNPVCRYLGDGPGGRGDS